MNILVELVLRILYFFWRLHERAVLGREFIVVRGDGGEGSITYGDEMEILCFANGMTAVIDEHDQPVREVERPWLSIYLDWLEEHDVDPATVTISLPDGREVKPYKTAEGWRWEWNGYRPKSENQKE